MKFGEKVRDLRKKHSLTQDELAQCLGIMPNFFDYPQAICKELENMGYEVDCFDDRPSTNGMVKAIIRVNKNLIGHYINRYFEKVMKTVRAKKI